MVSPIIFITALCTHTSPSSVKSQNITIYNNNGASLPSSKSPMMQFPPINRPPAWGWDTVGHMVFAHVTKTTEFNQTDLDWLQKYSIVQFDKKQNVLSMPNSSQEDRFIAAARQVLHLLFLYFVFAFFSLQTFCHSMI